MLDAIRRNIGSWVVKLLFVVLVLSFGVWGIADVVSPRSNADWAAEVGDTRISRAVYQEEYQETLRRVGEAFGGRIDAEQAQALGLPATVLNRMIDGALLDQAAGDLGILIGDEAIRESIRADSRFHNAAGQFDPEVFRGILRRAGFSEERYVTLLRSDLQREQLLTSLTGGAMPPKAVVETIERYRGERRAADFVLLAAAADAGLSAPDDATLRQFHQDFPGLFSAPELRSLSAILLTADAVSAHQQVSESALQAAYQERLGEFTRPERRSFRQGVFADEAAVARARERIGQGAPLAEVAVEVGGAATPPAVLGPLARDQMPAELADAVFALPVGQVSAPVRSPLGWHLVELTAIEAGDVEPFTAVRERLEGALRHEKALDELVTLSNRLEDTLGRGATLAETAAELGLPLRRIEAIDAGGRDAAGNPVPDLPERFVNTAFETLQGTESALIEADRDGYFVVHVDQVTPAAVRPFEAARNQVLEAWRQRQRDERSKQQAEQLAEKVRGGASLAAAAGERGAKVQTSPPFTRSDSPPDGLTPPLIEALFAARPGETVVVPAADGYAVAKLTAILPPAPDTDGSAAKAVRAELEDAFRGDIQGQLTAALRERYPVTINPRAFDQAL